MQGIERVLEIFYKLCEIPHGSGNCAKIAEFCARFAAEHGAVAECDEHSNVIVFKDGVGEPIAVQAHLDMVCEKNTDVSFDFQNEGIRVKRQGDSIFAEDTTLGADDGIGVAMCLALLESDIKRPLYVILTSDEETGLVGADSIDLSAVEAGKLINLDSEEEGVITVGCADGYLLRCGINTSVCAVSNVCFDASQNRKNAAEKRAYRIKVGGLAGGHSGTDIANRDNAIKLLCAVLEKLSGNVTLCNIAGGGRHSAIPRNAEALIIASCNNFIGTFSKILEEVKKGCMENRVSIELEAAEMPNTTLSFESTEAVIKLLAALPSGVIKQSEVFENQVETSLNLASVKLKDGALSAELMIRSNTEGESEKLAKSLQKICHDNGGNADYRKLYPVWEYRADSLLAKKAASVYRDMFGKQPDVCTIHAGLECGVLAKKLRNPDCISIGPDMKGVHTTNESLSVSSAERVFEYLKELCKAEES